jgi:hypothetical protein
VAYINLSCFSVGVKSKVSVLEGKIKEPETNLKEANTALMSRANGSGAMVNRANGDGDSASGAVSNEASPSNVRNSQVSFC